MKLISLIFAMVFALCGIAQAQLEIPQLREGQFVYTIPSGFNPPMIGPTGIDEINRVANELRYPYYIVLVESLPGSGDGDRRAANAINYLAQKWGERYASFDLAKSQIFLLAYEPRKYRFLAGSKFESELGFRNNAHDPYTAIFAQSVQSQRKDPKSGIINMMRAVDGYLFEETDPARIAARREAARKAAEQERLMTAQGMLNEQISRLDDLLKDKDFLPSDVSGYETSLIEARKVRSANNPAAMLSTAASLRSDTDKLAKFVDSHRRVAAEAALWKFMQWLIAIGVIVVAAIFAIARRRRQLDLMEDFDYEAGLRATMTTNAAQRFYAFYGERGDILALTDVTGKTAALREQVTKEVDEIYVGVEALREHTERCKKLAAQAGYFNIRPLEDALRDLDSSFEFDTGRINPDQLFEQETKVIRIEPKDLVSQLQTRFEQTVQGWDELKAAIAAREKPAEEHFPSSTLEELYKLADEHQIPHRWLNDHPLAGDDAADGNVYAAVNALSWSDPIAYVEKIEELKAAEKAVVEQIKAIVTAIKLAVSNRFDKLETLDTKVDPGDDPKTSFDRAQREQDKLAGVLASAKTVEEVEAQAAKVDELYRKSAEQAATLKSALAGVAKAINDAGKLSQTVLQDFVVAEERLKRAEKVHAKVNSSFHETARRYFQEGQRDLEKAKLQLGEKRHLNARNNANRAGEKFDQALDFAHRSDRHCQDLDQKKAEFEKRAEKMEANRSKLQRQLREYGSDAKLDGYVRPQINGLVDYAILLAMLDKSENAWEGKVRHAKNDYEEEQRRIREAEEAARRRREREEEESRQSSYSSSYSSSWGSSDSGSSWGGGDSSSGGSFGGGGDSSSGGSW